MNTNGGSENEPSELIQEDFSVYVAPASAAAPDDDELIARLEPTIAVVAWPLFLLAVLFFLIYARWSGVREGTLGFHAWMLRYYLVAVIGILGALAVIPSFVASSYYAELYGDRLIVRRGKRESAVPLEQIESIEPLPQSLTGESDWLMSAFDSLVRLGRLDRSSGESHTVTTTFGTSFWIPPFPGQEEFAMKVYQQRAERLKLLPPVVRGTAAEHEGRDPFGGEPA